MQEKENQTAEDVQLLSEGRKAENSEEAAEIEVSGIDRIPPLTLREIYAQVPRGQFKRFMYHIKQSAFSLDAEKFNGAFAEYLSFVELGVDLQETELSTLNEMVLRRAGNVSELVEAYGALLIGRKFFSLLSKEGLVTNIAIENLKQEVESLRANKFIDKEILATAYHNVALLYENYADTKSNPNVRTKALESSAKYMRKALVLTGNIQLIRTCNEYLSERTNNKAVILREACERALRNKENRTHEAMFDIYSIYAKSFLIRDNVSDTLSSGGKSSTELALIYYREALKHASLDSDKVKTLHNIAKLEKGVDKTAYLNTEMKLANMFSGRDKVLRLMRLATEVEREKKIPILESAVNELVDTPKIPAAERRLMWKNISVDLRRSYGNNPKKHQRLDSIEKLYFSENLDEVQSRNKVTSSSKGNNYFSAKKGNER